MPKYMCLKYLHLKQVIEFEKSLKFLGVEKLFGIWKIKGTEILVELVNEDF